MFVVDASMALAWCFDDESTPATVDVLHRLLLEGGIVPAHWPLEIANALRFAAESGRVDEPTIARARTIVMDLPIDVLPVETPTALGLIEPAQRHRLTVYDAAYLELADIRGLGLATLDGRLAAACRKTGVSLIAA
ncbi:MAG TPA: type II toxin-antitoxin system VapC family toxin [Candidatus Limnocylindrales bacterium]|jgi:predicted nucleic acid-binding protein|nr:type II toxin-antitoxin system VapC family toxin [Candidatus Limnocylindrales bacterium]